MWSQEITPKKKWSEQKTMNFVREYRINDCLWDVNHKDYKNRRIREIVCCKMADKFTCTPDDVRRKIKSLRGAYCHERNKIKDSLESNFDVNNVYVPSVIWYDEMDAVMNGGGSEAENEASSQPDNAEHTIDNEHHIGDDGNENIYKKDDCSSYNDNSDDERASEVSQAERSTKINKVVSKSVERSSNSEPSLHKVSSNSLSLVRKSKKDHSHTLFAAIDKLHDISSRTGENAVQENEFDLFGRCVAQQLKNFKDVKTALRVQHKIQGILSEERIWEMTNTEQICSNSTTQQLNSSSLIQSTNIQESAVNSDKSNAQIGLSGFMPIDLENAKFG